MRVVTERDRSKNRSSGRLAQNLDLSEFRKLMISSESNPASPSEMDRSVLFKRPAMNSSTLPSPFTLPSDLSPVSRASASFPANSKTRSRPLSPKIRSFLEYADQSRMSTMAYPAIPAPRCVCLERSHTPVEAFPRASMRVFVRASRAAVGDRWRSPGSSFRPVSTDMPISPQAPHWIARVGHAFWDRRSASQSRKALPAT
mmetsp:Transcript_7226/g.11208  ORF Transcript_7226/g.11208 Transcript_7226/m.11208 type:complete len:201 (-) Transcript_7226:1935-2537(-)